MFKTPACPVACKYCCVTEVSYRKKEWETGKAISINKVVTILNKKHTEWLEPKYFTSDILCFEASSDPFWMGRFNDFEKFCMNYAPVSRLITFVSKMPITNKHIKVLKKVEVPIVIVVSITGLDELGIEKTKRDFLYDNIKKCQDMGIPAIPLIHPYIHGLVNVHKLLEEFKKLGIKYYQIKGFRFDSSMIWLPKEVYEFYKDKEGIEYMPELDLQAEGITRIELRDFYRMYQLPPKIDCEQAAEYVSEIIKYAIITSSAPKEEVIEYAIKRRCE